MENSLYFYHATIYHHIANDRDFDKECTLLNNFYTKINDALPKAALELFAGPAYHSASLFKKGLREVYAIDYSEDMQKIACENTGFPRKNYLLGALPAAIDLLPESLSFDMVYLMRYSLGLISYDEAEQLIGKLVERLSPGAIAVLELHNIALLNQQLTDLDIKKRVTEDPSSGNLLSCTWPSGPISWEDHDRFITMPIQVDVEDKNRTILHSFETTSREYIFVPADIQRMTKMFGNVELLEVPRNLAEHFSQSKLVMLRKKT